MIPRPQASGRHIWLADPGSGYGVGEIDNGSVISLSFWTAYAKKAPPG
ncbi:MAG: hypothetical protein R6V27_02935 [Balneolaceae bacterium]